MTTNTTTARKLSYGQLQFIVSALPEIKLRPLAKSLGVPVPKYKEELVSELVRVIFRDSAKITITIEP